MWEGMFNRWLNGSIYADLGFFCTLNKDYTLAYEYFQKSRQIHPLLIAKYLPAYLQVIQATQPSLLRVRHYLNELASFKELDLHITFFTLWINYLEHPSKQQHNKIKTFMKQHVVSRLELDKYDPYHYYNHLFLYTIEKQKP